MTAEQALNRLRVFLLLFCAFIFTGTVLELLLEDHTEETLQLIPFALCAFGIISIVAVLLRPSKMTLTILRVVMLAVAFGGILGVVLHLNGNVGFEQEIRPNAAYTEVFLRAFKGGNPLLAPGILAFTAVVAFAATYYHPAFRVTSNE
ncbi:MAG: hypothetical protein U0528_07145 [Anaerolineae bacterium]